MKSSPEANRLRTAFELFDAGVQLMKARLRRNRPNASQAELDALLSEWLLDRPGAPLGDAPGRPIVWRRVS
jgi:hypothetical protein